MIPEISKKFLEDENNRGRMSVAATTHLYQSEFASCEDNQSPEKARKKTRQFLPKLRIFEDKKKLEVFNSLTRFREDSIGVLGKGDEDGDELGVKTQKRHHKQQSVRDFVTKYSSELPRIDSRGGRYRKMKSSSKVKMESQHVDL